MASVVEDSVAPLPEQIASALPALVAYVDRGQRYRFVSKGYETRFGRTAAELRGRQVREVIGEKAYATVRAHIEQALRGEPVNFAAQLPGVDGLTHAVEIHYSPHRDAAGQVVGYYALIVDIGEGDLKARRDREREQRLELAMDVAGLGDWSYDFEDGIVRFSARAAEIFGMQGRSEFPWVDFRELIEAGDGIGRPDTAAAIADGRPFEIECKLRRPSDGRSVWLLVRGQAVQRPEQGSPAVLGVVSDITRTKTAEAELLAERARLEELERSQSFLLRLSDTIRQSDDISAITRIASAMLGEYLGVLRVGYAELDESAEVLHLGPDWSSNGRSIAGNYPLASFGVSLGDFLRSGSTLVVNDSQADQRFQGAATRAMFDGFGAKSHLGVPLLRGGRAIAMLFVHAAEPRVWTKAEIGIVEAVAARTWADLERARTERSLRESEERFRIMADTAPAPVWVTGAAGGIAFVNQAFADFAGKPRDEMMGQGWTDLLDAKDLPEIMNRRNQAVADQRNFRFEARFRRHDGAMHWMQALSNARYDAEGRFLGFVGIAMDMTEVRKVEAALRESEERFRRIAEDAPVMMWICDAGGRPLYMNAMLRAFFGIQSDAPEDLDWSNKAHPDDADRTLGQFAAGLQREEPFWSEGRFIRADGEVRDIFSRAVPRRDADGAFIGMIGVNVDVTDARRAELHQQLLINELNHRVKNTLATVQSIAHQTLREGVMTRDARQLFTSRLLALSAAHNVLTRENWERAELHEIAEEAVRAHQDPARSRIAFAGPQVRLSPKHALAISMALHELSTNAVKYGALSVAGGRVEVRWSLDPAAEQATLVWRETGGPPVKAPARKGFGSRLLNQGLAIELGAGAEMDYAPEGLICTIRASLKA